MKKLFILVVSVFILTDLSAQQVFYSQPDNSDNQNTNFDIIGKIGENYLIYKNIRNNHYISVYDASMNQKDRINLKMLPDKVLNVDFVAYPEYAWMIYQFQQRNIIYCMGAKINGDGKLMKDPVVLDTSHVGFFADKKIYTTIHSEDKNKIMVFKIQKKNSFFNFTTLLFDEALQLHHISRIYTSYQDKKYIFSDFLVSNKGNFIFTAGNRSTSRDYIEDLRFIVKAPDADSFYVMNLNLNGRYLDEIKLKVDNLNTNFLLNSFYYSRKRGNTEGMFTAVIDEETNSLISETFAQISDTLRANLKDKGSDKTALNDFFIRDVILKKDGGFLLTAEDFYSQSRYSPWNRWDYLYGDPYYGSPYGYYSPYYFNYYGRGYGYFNNNDTRYYYNNILVLSLDSTGKYEWTNVIRKAQYDDQTDNFLSYALMITGGKLHFIFNENNRRSYILTDRSVNGSGDIARVPPMHNLDRGYDFMPRYAKQVSASEIIIPCMYRNIICFAKIQF